MERRRVRRGVLRGGRFGVVLLVAAGWAAVPEGAAGQQQGPDRVRGPTSHANVHTGPSTSQQVLWLAPEGEVLEVVDLRGEWVAVRLTPEMRQRGIVLRWYSNEDVGWMHESTVEDAD